MERYGLKMSRGEREKKEEEEKGRKKERKESSRPLPFLHLSFIPPGPQADTTILMDMK